MRYTIYTDRHVHYLVAFFRLAIVVVVSYRYVN
jgi:hypothetical protein